jgi:hypothetical protein
MEKKRKRRVKLGDIYAIPLPNGMYAFGRVMRDAGIAIYKYIGSSVEDIPKTEEYQFIVGVYKDVLQGGAWTVVGNRPFNNEEESWPPKEYILDQINGSYRIYHKGEMIPSTQEECEGLEEATVWDAHHIIDRIMGEDKWNKI